MRLILAAVILAVCLGAEAGKDKYETLLKNWGKMKAMEGCFGADNFKMWMMKMKKAKSHCSGIPAPELALPIFKGPVRIANALLESGFTSQQEAFLDNKMRQAFVMSLMKKAMGGLEEDDDDAMPYFVNKYALAAKSKRAADDDADMDERDLGDMMVNKITHMKEEIESQIGNFTCVMTELGYINDDMEIDVAGMDKCLDEGQFQPTKEDPTDRTWLQGRLKELHAVCKEFTDNLPQSLLDQCSMPDYLTKIKYFKKCMKMHKLEACMHFDTRQKIQAHGQTVEDLAEAAGIEEDDQVVGLVSMMLYQF